MIFFLCRCKDGKWLAEFNQSKGLPVKYKVGEGGKFVERVCREVIMQTVSSKLRRSIVMSNVGII